MTRSLQLIFKKLADKLNYKVSYITSLTVYTLHYFQHPQLAATTMDGSEDGILQLVQRLCESVLTHTPVQADRSNNGYTPTFQVPHHLPRGWDMKRKLALKHLTRTAFDLILLRKWAWFGVWASELPPECRCLAHTYDMHLQGLHREAARLENAVSALIGEGITLLSEPHACTLKFSTGNAHSCNFMHGPVPCY